MEAGISTPPGGHAAVYDAVMWPFERIAVSGWRRRLAAGARGRVLEIGTGTGAQLRWYGAGASVTALEPDASMRERARRRAALAAARVTVVDGRAEELPFTDASFDAAVSAFALCTVAYPEAALAELRRVLVPGGRSSCWSTCTCTGSRGGPCRARRPRPGPPSPAAAASTETR